MLKVANSVINTSQIAGVLPVVNGGTGVSTSTGTGNTVLSNNPTFTSVNATGVISALSGGTATAQINASPIANEGAFLMSTAPGQFRLSGGCVYNAPDWKARSTEAVIVGHDSGGSFVVYADSGLTIGNTFSPTTRTIVSSTGVVTFSNYGAGAATFSAAGVISSVSDETWKIKDGIPTNPDAMLKKLQPGYWYYNDEKKETFGSDRQLGFYAQNVNAAIGPEAAPKPETFTTKNEDGTETITTKPWGYYDRSVLAVTVMSLQKALKTIELLTARVAALEAK